MSDAHIEVNGGDVTEEPQKPPKAPSPPEPFQARGANCNWFDDDCAQLGLPGGDGADGVAGARGGTGGNGGSLDFEADVINGAVKFHAHGGRGGWVARAAMAEEVGMQGQAAMAGTAAAFSCDAASTIPPTATHSTHTVAPPGALEPQGLVVSGVIRAIREPPAETSLRAATARILEYSLSQGDPAPRGNHRTRTPQAELGMARSEEHTSE